MLTMVPMLQALGILTLLYLVISVHSSYTNKSYSRHHLMEAEFSLVMNQSHPKSGRRKSGYSSHPSIDQHITSVMTSMSNLTRHQNNEAKRSYSRHPSMEPQFPSIMNSMTNLTHLKDKREKTSRIFSFSDMDNEISVELGFTIPFITIPVKGVNDNEKPLVNVNVGAITAGTILTTAALIFIPKAFSGLEPEISFGKSSSSGERRKSGFLSRMDKALMDHNIDTSICTQRAVCWIVQTAASKVTTGEGGSMDKIIDGIASNTLLERLVQGTAFQEAIHNGRRDKDCSIIYAKCPITQAAIQQIARSFIRGIV